MRLNAFIPCSIPPTPTALHHMLHWNLADKHAAPWPLCMCTSLPARKILNLPARTCRPSVDQQLRRLRPFTSSHTPHPQVLLQACTLPTLPSPQQVMLPHGQSRRKMLPEKRCSTTLYFGGHPAALLIIGARSGPIPLNNQPTRNMQHTNHHKPALLAPPGPSEPAPPLSSKLSLSMSLCLDAHTHMHHTPQ